MTNTTIRPRRRAAYAALAALLVAGCGSGGTAGTETADAAQQAPDMEPTTTTTTTTPEPTTTTTLEPTTTTITTPESMTTTTTPTVTVPAPDPARNKWRQDHAADSLLIRLPAWWAEEPPSEDSWYEMLAYVELLHAGDEVRRPEMTAGCAIGQDRDSRCWLLSTWTPLPVTYDNHWTVCSFLRCWGHDGDSDPYNDHNLPGMLIVEGEPPFDPNESDAAVEFHKRYRLALDALRLVAVPSEIFGEEIFCLYDARWKGFDSYAEVFGASADCRTADGSHRVLLQTPALGTPMGDCADAADALWDDEYAWDRCVWAEAADRTLRKAEAEALLADVWTRVLADYKPDRPPDLVEGTCGLLAVACYVPEAHSIRLSSSFTLSTLLHELAHALTANDPVMSDCLASEWEAHAGSCHHGDVWRCAAADLYWRYGDVDRAMDGCTQLHPNWSSSLLRSAVWTP